MDIISKIKDIGAVLQKADNIELYRNILDVQNEMMTLQEENRRLKDENDELKRVRDIILVLSDDRKFYYEKKDGILQDIPYCIRCWENDHKLIPMHKVDRGQYTYEVCPSCKNEIETAYRKIDLSSIEPII